jgi:hypothetical protein
MKGEGHLAQDSEAAPKGGFLTAAKGHLHTTLQLIRTAPTMVDFLRLPHVFCYFFFQ